MDRNRRQASSQYRYAKHRKKRLFLARAKVIALLLVAAAGITGIVFAATRIIPQMTASGDDGSGAASLNASQTASESTADESQTESAVEAQPLDSYTVFEDWNQDCDLLMILVNNGNPIPDRFEYQPGEWHGVEIDQRVAQALDDMINDAGHEGISLWVSSAYRSADYQQQLLEQEIQGNIEQGLASSEAVVKASAAVAQPNHSEHNTGLAVDFNGVESDFYNTDAYAWLSAHAAEYGFIERYPDGKQDITGIIYEPWHYRYVGVENAKAIKESGLCLEEYVQSLQKN